MSLINVLRNVINVFRVDEEGRCCRDLEIAD